MATTENKSLFQLGDLVTLKGHPYFVYDDGDGEGELENLIPIASDAEFISPVFVVIEYTKNGTVNDNFDIKTGFKKIKGIEYKCLYFSSASKKFEEKWINELFLKKIQSSKVLETNHTELRGRSVILRSWRVENAKKKTYLKQNNQGIFESTTLSQLSHLPPIMYVIGYHKKDDDASNQFDKKTGLPIRTFAKDLYKCQWFNPKNGSFSEILLPSQAFEIIEETDYRKLAKLKTILVNGDYLLLEGNKRTLIKPIRIIFNHCEYVLVYEDLIKGGQNQIEITKDFNINQVKKNKSDLASISEETLIRAEINEINEELINNARTFIERNQNAYIRMIYTNRSEIHTTRTISDAIPLGKYYFKAMCSLRKEIRTFRFHGVNGFEKLDFSPDND